MSSKAGRKMNGEVIWFNPMRSYGFIACDDNEEDAYVGYQDIIGDGYRTLNAGQRVQFRLITQGDGEFKAVEVTGPNGAPIDNDLKNLPPKGDGDSDKADKPRARQSRRRESTRGGGRGGRVSRGGGGGGGGGGRSQYKRRDARDESDEKRDEKRDEKVSDRRGGGNGRGRGRGGKAVASKGKGKVLRGEVVWFNARRGYGWISVSGEKEDAYVSYGDIKSDGYARLNDGEEVEFKLMRQDGGDLKAVEVTAPGGGPINNDLKKGGSGRGGGRGGRGDRGDRARDRRDYR